MDKVKSARGVFSQPVRKLTKEEMLRVGGGYKNDGGPDNQSRDWNTHLP